MGNVTAKSISSNLSDAEKQVVRDNIEAAPLASPSLTGTPTAPTPTAGDDSTKLATTAFVKAKSELDSIGVNQTWQDVTASRGAGVTYTNTTGKPIFVSISAYNTNTGGRTYGFIINGVNMVYMYENNVNDQQHEVLVPAGSTYQYVMPSGSIAKWFELR